MTEVQASFMKGRQFVQQWVDSLPHEREDNSSECNSPCCSRSSNGGEGSVEFTELHTGASRNRSDSRNSARGGLRKFSETECIRRGKLVWMHSNCSSFTSDASIDALLKERQVNPEEVLMNLGFGAPQESLEARLPSRFFMGPTHAEGINLNAFLLEHPELGGTLLAQQSAAMGELYSKLPVYYHSNDPAKVHTTLHRKLTFDTQESSMMRQTAQCTVHHTNDGSTFTSILSDPNAQELARRGFYNMAEPPVRSLISPGRDSHSSSLSTNDCTVESSEPPSPIILNNQVSSESQENSRPNLSHSSSLSDSVFSSTEEYPVNQRVKAKLEAIQEKPLHDLAEDLEEGISFNPIISRSQSAGEYMPKPELKVSIDKARLKGKRQAFAGGKSYSFDEERLASALNDIAGHRSLGVDVPSSDCPVILTTSDSFESGEDDSPSRVIPTQRSGMLQVLVPDSFDSVESDTATLIPSNSATPRHGLSPNTSRNGSLSVISHVDSFELEEVQSSEACMNDSPPSRTKRRLQMCRSASGQSDSSGIADVDEGVHGVTTPPDVRRDTESLCDSYNTAAPEISHEIITPTKISLSKQNSTSSSQTDRSIATTTSDTQTDSIMCDNASQTYRLLDVSEIDMEKLLENNGLNTSITQTEDNGGHCCHCKATKIQAQHHAESTDESNTYDSPVRPKIRFHLESTSESNGDSNSGDGIDNYDVLRDDYSSSSSDQLADRLHFTQNRLKYERKMAELERQKMEIEMMMKDEELEYWRSMQIWVPATLDKYFDQAGYTQVPSLFSFQYETELSRSLNEDNKKVVHGMDIFMLTIGCTMTLKAVVEWVLVQVLWLYLKCCLFLSYIPEVWQLLKSGWSNAAGAAFGSNDLSSARNHYATREHLERPPLHHFGDFYSSTFRQRTRPPPDERALNPLPPPRPPKMTQRDQPVCIQMTEDSSSSHKRTKSSIIDRHTILIHSDTEEDSTALHENNQALQNGHRKPELYPEVKVTTPPPSLVPPRAVNVPILRGYDILRHTNTVLAFLEHKVDIVQKSLLLYQNNLGDMSHLAVTTPACDKVDREFCICHKDFDCASSRRALELGSILPYLCDKDKCTACSKMYKKFIGNGEQGLLITDLNLNMLSRGAVSFSGDGEDDWLAFIFATSSVWHDSERCMLELSDLLSYYLSTTSRGRISIIIDARQACHQIFHMIMESVHNIQKRSQGGVTVARVLIDRPSQTGAIVRSLRQTTTTLQVDFLSSDQCLKKVTTIERLPRQLGGSHNFDHENWINFHTNVERHLQGYQKALGDFLSTTHTLSRVPRTIRHSTRVIQNHQDIQSATLDNHSLCRRLLADPGTRNILADLEQFMRGTDAFRQIMQSLHNLGRVGKQVTRLQKLAEERLTRLYGCQKVWFCIEEITKTLTLLKRAHELINKHRVVSNNLRSAQVQYHNFNKIEGSIKKLLIQANELLAEALGVLCEAPSPIPWLEQLVTKLKAELEFLTSLLDKTRKLINLTYECYTELDKAYDWAVEAMKFVSSMNMDNCLTSEGVDSLSASLSSFLRGRDMIDDSVFESVSQKAQLLRNRKLMEQCRVAHTRCDETKQLLFVRQTTIKKSKEEMEAQRAVRINHDALSGDITPIPKSPSNSETSTVTEDIWVLPNHTQSAPTTPALTLRCDSRSETRRKSQSLEDSINFTATQQEPPSPVHEEENSNSVAAPETVEEEPGVDLTRRCSTVDRHDKYLHVSDEDVTMPIEDTTINNNIKRQSSFVEGEIMTFTPSSSRQPSIDDGLQEESDSQRDSWASAPEELTNSNEDLLDAKPVEESSTSEVSIELRKHSSVSPILTSKQKQQAMQKRRSFHGFTSSIASLPSFFNFGKSKKAAEDKIKRLSADSSISVSEHDEVDDFSQVIMSIEEKVEGMKSPILAPRTVMDQIQELNCIENSLKENSLREERHEKCMSLVTGSSESLASLPEDSVANDVMSSSLNGWTPVPVNSHLISNRVLPSNHYSSMADLRLTEAEMRSRRTLAHVMDELLQTERDYVVALQLVVENYMPEMNREDVPQPLRGNRCTIFGNIEKIFDFHNHYFLKELIKCENEPFKISHCFLSHESDFLIYALYNKNKPKSDTLMADHGATFFKDQQMKMGDKMDLSSYLLKPVQRMGKYALILKQILKECPASAPEHQELCDAEEMIRFCLQHGNDLLAMDALQDCDVNLQEQGTLLLQDEFSVIRNKHKSVRHIFLFEQMLVFAKVKKIGAGRDQYAYKYSLKTADLGLTENVGNSGLKFEIWFRKRTGDNWIIQASTPHLKNKWVNTFEKMLWNQALKNRESRLTELTSMGVGHKPSLDLKKSDDNINDRFVDFQSKGIQRRYAKTPGEEEKMMNESSAKRPHSVISLGSSSSSNSSSGAVPGNATYNTILSNIPWGNNSTGTKSHPASHSRSEQRQMKRLHRCDSKVQRSDSGVSSMSDHSHLLISPCLMKASASTPAQLSNYETDV